MTDTVQQLAADLTREAQETGLNWVQELADRATALADERRGDISTSADARHRPVETHPAMTVGGVTVPAMVECEWCAGLMGCGCCSWEFGTRDDGSPASAWPCREAEDAESAACTRAILLDLITELRDGRECYLSGECCGVEARLDRAEARLREVTGDE